MPSGYATQAVQSVLNSTQAFCKFLKANDTGATGGNQCGILISRSAGEMLFSENLNEHHILKRNVEILWQNEIVTPSCFTYYDSKKELRITRFGRGFPFLNPDQTGALFVFTRQAEDHYSGFFLETDDDIEHFLGAFGISPTETNRLIDTRQVNAESREAMAIQEFIAGLTVDFPLSDQMSAAARSICDKVYRQAHYVRTNPDKKIIDWTNTEYSLFRAIEHARYGETISQGFTSVEDFVSMANMVLNRRKSRAGKSLEHHLAAIFDGNGIQYDAQAVTEGRKKPDFLFPSKLAYHDSSFPSDKLITLAAKTTCKDRWRQILNEADRLRNKPKFLCTLQQGISPAQMDEMQSENVVLVVPRPYIDTYPEDRKDRIWTLAKFVGYIKEVEGI